MACLWYLFVLYTTFVLGGRQIGQTGRGRLDSVDIGRDETVLEDEGHVVGVGVFQDQVPVLGIEAQVA